MASAPGSPAAWRLGVGCLERPRRGRSRGGWQWASVASDPERNLAMARSRTGGVESVLLSRWCCMAELWWWALCRRLLGRSSELAARQQSCMLREARSSASIMFCHATDHGILWMIIKCHDDHGILWLSDTHIGDIRRSDTPLGECKELGR